MFKMVLTIVNNNSIAAVSAWNPRMLKYKGDGRESGWAARARKNNIMVQKKNTYLKCP